MRPASHAESANVEQSTDSSHIASVECAGRSPHGSVDNEALLTAFILKPRIARPIASCFFYGHAAHDGDQSLEAIAAYGTSRPIMPTPTANFND